MAGQNIVYKNLASFKGLDLRSSDLIREKDNATDVTNAEYRQTGALNKRNGYQYVGSNADACYGQTTFKNANITTGAITEEIIGIDDNLLKLTSYTFNITYSGSNTARYEMYVKAGTANTWYFKIIDGVTEVLDTDLGNGSEGSPVTVSDLVTLINALSDFSAGTISGGGTTPAAYAVPATGGETAIATTPGTTITFENWANVSTPTGYSNPFTTFFGKITDTDFENASFAQINNVLYIATGHNDLHKYDGTRVYKAGIPQATTPTAADAASDAGSFANNRIVRYKIISSYTDAKGNVTKGQISSHVAQTASGTGEAINVTYTELTGAAGYDVDGTLKYEIYRTDDSADATATSLYYLVQTADHGDTIPWKDTGAAEGAEYVPPVKTPGTPPKTRYIDTWRGQLLLAGDLANVDTVYYSDVTSPEHFPSGDNSFILDNKINGIKVIDNVLYAFENNAINAITGDFGVDNFQVDPASREGIGCVAHHTIQEVKGQLMFLADRGVYSIAPGMERPLFIGEPISPKFSRGHSFTFKQAVAYNWQEGDKYLLFMPNLPVDPSYSADASNETYVYDYFRGAWLKWTIFNFMGGISEKGNDLYFSGRVSGKRYCQRLLQTGTAFDYADHIATIVFTHKSNWETLGEPSQWKKFLRLKVHSYDTTINDFESQVFSIICKQEIDWDTSNTVTIATMDFSGGTTGWGLDAWGQFPWGQARLKQLTRKMMSKKAKSTRIIFENSTLHQNILISGYSMQVAVAHQNNFHE